MNDNTPITPSTDQQPVESQPWTTPVLKKMDIEETAFGGQQNDDLDGFS